MRLPSDARLLTEQNSKHNMEEKDVIKFLNWIYYGVMVLTLIILSFMYYYSTGPQGIVIDPNSQMGIIMQYVVIGMALVFIPGGLYLVKWLKPDNLIKYQHVAMYRIVLVGGIMPVAIAAFYLLGGYRPMMWVAAMAAVAWYFTKPTLGKLEQEMKPEDPNIPTY